MPENKTQPPETISEVNRALIEQTGEAYDTYLGRILTREDLAAYDKAQRAATGKKG
jgi:hypothetical protein